MINIIRTLESSRKGGTPLLSQGIHNLESSLTTFRGMIV